MTVVLVIILAIAALILALIIRLAYIYRKGYYALWIPSYIKGDYRHAPDRNLRSGPLHIVLVIADHFEPGSSTRFLADWITRYRTVINGHHDSFGNSVRRTMHYPIEQFHYSQIEMLLPLCREKLVEIEMQLHHFDDTSQSVLAKYQQGLADFARFGICRTTDDPPQTRFAFVHGNWALDNSAS